MTKRVDSEALVEMSRLRSWLLREAGSKESRDPAWVHRYESLGLHLFVLVTPSLSAGGVLQSLDEVRGWAEWLADRSAQTGDTAGEAFAANVLQFVCGRIGAVVAAKRGVA
jgi:hypothetical protein